jgi:4-hydroxy-2-oxoheptanedioate aldolase
MNIIAAAGFDFVVIDLEHGPASFETVEAMARAARSEQVSAIVRLGTISAEQILRSLDCGVEGVLTGHVQSGAAARDVVALCKYHPAGARGFSPYTRAGGYSGGDITGHTRRQNERTVVGVILEGQEAIEELDAILETRQLDLVYIGAYDLSQALGIPGEVQHPKVRKHMEVCVRRIRDAGVAAGGHVARTADDMAWMVDIGMQFVTYLPDCAVLSNALRTAVDAFRKLVR